MFDIVYFKKNLQSLKYKIKKKNPVFFISTNFFNLGLSESEIKNICKILSKELSSFKNSTILVPTATLNILENNKIFDVDKTKSSRMGFFSEYIRTKKNSKRSNHPIWSFSAIGKNAKKILKDVPKNSYGKNSVFDRLLSYNTYFICIGDIKNSISPIHYVEQMVGVPYRFFKEFKIKMRNKNKIKKEVIYFYAMLENKKIKKDYNLKSLKKLIKNKTVKIFNYRNFDIYFSDYKELIKDLINIFDKNPKIFLKDENINFEKNLRYQI